MINLIKKGDKTGKNKILNRVKLKEAMPDFKAYKAVNRHQQKKVNSRGNEIQDLNTLIGK